MVNSSDSVSSSSQRSNTQRQFTAGKVKIGDLVKITNGPSKGVIGEVKEITKVYDTRLTILTRYNYRLFAVPRSSVQRIEPEYQNFNIGDYVNFKYGPNEGKSGRVTQIDITYGLTIRLLDSGHSKTRVPRTALELLSSNSDVFNTGDLVFFYRGPNFGKIGDITIIDKATGPTIRFVDY